MGYHKTGWMKGMGFLWLCLMAQVGRAQTAAEWFEQNSTRLAYYAQQIAALQIYLGEEKKGYDISSAGLGVIGRSKDVENTLHQGYYASLGQINPLVAGMPEVSEIDSLQEVMMQRSAASLAKYNRDGLFSAGQLSYIGGVFTRAVQAGMEDVNGLADLLTAGKLQMTDDERMTGIRVLDGAMRGRYGFMMGFTDQADLMEMQVAFDKAGLGVVEGLYGIP